MPDADPRFPGAANGWSRILPGRVDEKEIEVYFSSLLYSNSELFGDHRRKGSGLDVSSSSSHMVDASFYVTKLQKTVHAFTCST